VRDLSWSGYGYGEQLAINGPSTVITAGPGPNSPSNPIPDGAPPPPGPEDQDQPQLTQTTITTLPNTNGDQKLYGTSPTQVSVPQSKSSANPNQTVDDKTKNIQENNKNVSASISNKTSGNGYIIKPPPPGPEDQDKSP
jgi:hypothetical protein